MDIEIRYIRDYIKRELEDIAGLMMSGVDSFENYRELVGRASALERINAKLREYEQQQAEAMGDYPSEENAE